MRRLGQRARRRNEGQSSKAEGSPLRMESRLIERQKQSVREDESGRTC